MHACMHVCKMIHNFLPILRLAVVVMLSCRDFILFMLSLRVFQSSIVFSHSFPNSFYHVMTLCIFSKVFSFKIPSLFLVWALPISEIQFQQRFHLSNVSPYVCMCESFIKNCVQPELVYASTTCRLVLTFGSFYPFICLRRLTPS